MGQRRKDREWPTPATTRHVWVEQPGIQRPPIQGYVLDWRRHSYRWSALVVIVFVDEGHPIVVQRWIPVEQLTPVKSDPNLGRPRNYY